MNDARSSGGSRSGVTAVQVVAEVVLAGLSAAAAASAWVAVFPQRAILAPVLVATAGATTLTIITRLARLPGTLAAALHLPAVAVALRLLIGGDPSQLASGVLRGWARVLDSTLPAGTSADQRVIAPLASWAVAAVACGLVARTRRPWVHLWPLIASLVVVRVLATRGMDGGVLAAAVGALAVAAVLVVVRSHRGGLAQLARLGPSAAAGLVGGLAGLALVPGLAPFDLSARRHPDRDEPPPVVSPLALLKAAQGDTTTLFTVTATARSPAPLDLGPLYLRLAVLDAYRGGDWVPSGLFQATGGRVPPAPAEPSATYRIDQELTIESLVGPWVPAADRAVTVARSPRPVQTDPATGTIVVTGGVRPGDRFSLTSRVARPDTASLLGSRSDPAFAELGQIIEGTPPLLVSVAQAWTADTVSDFDRVAALQGHFARTFAVNDRADSGRSLSQLLRFVQVTQVGTSEQFATAFVVLARAVGLPARVAVGFRVPVGPTSTVIGRQLEAWPEVALADGSGRPLGWVPFDPAPTDTRERPIPKPEDSAPSIVADDVANDRLDPPPVPPVVTPQTTRRSPWARRLLVLGVLPVVLGAGVPALVAAGRGRRTAARRRGPASARVSGAWAESLEALAARGLPDQRARTVTETIDETTLLATIGRPAAGHLASIGATLSRALFVDEDGVSDGDADAAWAEALAVRHLANSARSRREKVRAAYDMRVLIGL